MITKEQEVKNKIRAKGILTDVTEDGLVIEDEKTGESEVLTLDDFKFLEGGIVTITVSDSTKKEI